jgi:hypothetical protein
MKYMQAGEFNKEYEYDSYKKETKKKERSFRKERKEKRDRWANTIAM